MALKINVDDSNVGISFPEAYARIVSARVTKYQVIYAVEVHASENARNTNKQTIRSDNFSVQMEDISGDIYPALYQHLKTHPFYASGIDC